MFKKVLIVDDHDAIVRGISQVLKSTGVKEVVTASYCDEAYLKIKKAIIDESPFELVISDLSFSKDHRENTLTSGRELIEVLYKESNPAKILVYTQEDHYGMIRELVNTFKVHGYICKSRRAEKELVKALELLYYNNTFFSENIQQAFSNSNNELTDYDVSLVKLLALGSSQNEISDWFKAQNIVPSSLSSIEKRINHLKDIFDAKNATHLVSTMKDLQLI